MKRRRSAAAEFGQQPKLPKLSSVPMKLTKLHCVPGGGWGDGANQPAVSRWATAMAHAARSQPQPCCTRLARLATLASRSCARAGCVVPGAPPRSSRSGLGLCDEDSLPTTKLSTIYSLGRLQYMGGCSAGSWQGSALAQDHHLATQVGRGGPVLRPQKATSALGGGGKMDEGGVHSCAGGK